MNSTQREHDFLSFLSLFVHTYDRLDIDWTLLSVLLNKSTVSLHRPTGYGGFFSVTVTKGQELLDARPIKGVFANEATFPKVVALKAPIINGSLNDARNRKIWSSMAMELQVLKNDFIRKHNNIVSLFGVCWQAVDANNTSFMPVLVLDAAEMGDLQTFFTKTENLSQRKMLGLAIDVTAGVRALHDVGIIHCDIKPQNILIYKDDRLSFVAKVADFGSSLLLSEVVGEIKLPAGTEKWQAPECEGPIGLDQLVKSDIYSLGLVLLFMLSGGAAMKVFEAQDRGEVDLGGSMEDLKRSGKIAGLAICVLRQLWDMHEQNPDGEDGEEDGDGPLSIGSELAYLVIQTLNEPSQRTSEAKMVLASLRHTLHRVLREELLRPLQPDRLDSPIDINPQEKDILLDPCMSPHHLVSVLCTM
jgi:serine/threonine protein kinase